jgi:hypothetical protein
MGGSVGLNEREKTLAAAILRQAERSRAWLAGSVVMEPCGGKGVNKTAAAQKRKKKRKARGRGPKMKRVLSPTQAAAAKRRRAHIRGL